jgi:hypothetical protein
VLCVLIVLSGAPSALADNVRLSVDSTGLGAAVEFAPTGRLAGCGNTRCDYEFERGTTVYVTARPKAPSLFARWRGACTDAAPTCVVMLDQNKSLTARFTPVGLYMTIPSRYEGSVTVDPASNARCGPNCRAYPYGTQVAVRADAFENHVFRGWLGPSCGPVTGNVCRITLFQNADVTARFDCTGTGEEDCLGEISQPIEREVLTTVKVVGGGGRGSVQINGKRCSGRCELKIKRGSVVALRADSGGSQFVGFSGACTSASTRCQLAAFRDARGDFPLVTATFR